MYGYIYKTTDLTNNKIYIGQHKANKFDVEYFGSGVIITRLIEKYGVKRFRCELIEECSSCEELNSREIYWISYLDSRNPDIGYNIASGGAFGDSGYHLGMLGKRQSDYQRAQASLANKGENNPYNRIPELKEYKANQMRGNTNASGGKGLKFIHLGDIQKRVPEEEINSYLQKGWQRGKSDKVKQSQQEAYKLKYANGKYVTDGVNSKFVSNDKLDDWLNRGWKIGKGPKNYINREKKK